MSRLSQIADSYEEMVERDTLTWQPVDKATLDATTVLYLESILEPSGLQYVMAAERLDRTVLFKIEHRTIRYLHHDPLTEQHMWAGHGFHEALPNDEVLVMLRDLELAKLYMLN